MFMRVPDDLRDARQGGQLFGRALGIAAGDHDLCAGIFAVDSADGGAGVLIGGGGDRAGVQDDDFCVAQQPARSTPRSSNWRSMAAPSA